MTIKDNYFKIPICLILLILGISLVPVAAATDIPSVPNMHFVGNVTLGGVDAPVGTEISAYIDDTFVSSDEVATEGYYELAIAGTEQDTGKSIIFKIGNLNLISTTSYTYNYSHSFGDTVHLDLVFEGDYLDPILSNAVVSPATILSDGNDFSTISVTATDNMTDSATGISVVTLDLSSIGGEVVSMTSGENDVYTYDVSSTENGTFSFNITAWDYCDNSAVTTVSLNLIKTDEVVETYSGGDGFSAEEINSVVTNSTISDAVKYVALTEYYGDGWDLI